MMDNNELYRLITRSANGDRSAWHEICSAYHEDLYVTALSLTYSSAVAKEIVRQVENDGLGHLGDLQNLNDFEKWTDDLVKKYAKDHKSNLDTSDIPDEIYDSSLEENNDNPEISLSLSERQLLVSETLDCLNDLEQTVLLLYGYKRNSLKTIAEKINLSEADTEKILASAERKISRYIERNGINKKYEMAAIPFFLLVLSYLHPKVALQPVIHPSHVVDINNNDYKESIIKDKPEVEIRSKDKSENKFETSSFKNSINNENNISKSKNNGITLKTKVLIGTVVTVFVAGVISVTFVNRNLDKPENTPKSKTTITNSEEKSKASIKNEHPASTPAEETKEKYDTSGYYGWMSDKNVKIGDSDAYSEYGMIYCNDESPILDNGNIYIAKNQTLQKLEQKQVQLNDQSYTTEFVPTETWNGDIYISKNAILQYPAVEETYNNMTFTDFMANGFDYKGYDKKTYHKSPNHFALVITKIDENGFVTELMYDFKMNLFDNE